jgi:hypothetical protein
MNSLEFLDVLKSAFIRYLETGERSNEKLKILHGAIAKDLDSKFKHEDKAIYVHALGFGAGKEKKLDGRYVPKTVDIAIEKNGKPLAGIGVKYVMSNYMQNSVNYFENMLGETANIRSNSILYFQFFIIPDKIPYFGTAKGKSKPIIKWEKISQHNIDKYIATLFLLANASLS